MLVLAPWLALSVAAGSLSLASDDPSPRGHAPRPNVVLILADDMGWGDPGCFHAESKIPTPAMDRLAAEGMAFSDAHAPASLCVPTRYSLLTGRYPFRRTLRWNGGSTVDADRSTLPGVLRSAGYSTAMVGKWHLGFDGDPLEPDVALGGGPLDRGFGAYFGIPASLDIPPYYFIRGRQPVDPPTAHVAASHSDGWTNIQGAFWRAGGIAPTFRHEDVLPRFEEEAVAQVKALAAEESPYFLYVAFAGPHTPWLPGPDWEGRSEVGMYGDFTARVDAAVGRIVDAVDASGEAEETLIIVSSDNGPVWYPADVQRFEHASTGPYRGMKADAWEGGHRVPFLVRWPSVVPAGVRRDDLLCFVDLFRSVASLAGAMVPDGAAEDSLDLSALLRGDKPAEPLRRQLVLKTDGSVLRDGRWKLIDHLGSGGFSKPKKRAPKDGEPPGQLYDLTQDPGETRNLWSEQPVRAEAMLATLREIRGD